MNLIETARKYRLIIEQAMGSVEDKDALEAVSLFPKWKETESYKVGDRVKYNDVLYRCLQAHSAQAAWQPAAATSLWAKVLVIEDVILEWEQPDSTNPYQTGDKVLHNGKTWVSTVDNNVWEPGVYGWEEV